MKTPRRGFGWLDLLLALTLILLALQLSPALRSWLAVVANVREWSRTSWFVANFVVVLSLIGIRFGPDAVPAMQRLWRRLLHRASTRNRSAAAQEEYEQRSKRDADWRERAKKRLPFT